MLVDDVVNKLIAKNYHIACAESCTGGLVAASLVAVPGVSSVLDLSLVTYANEAKEHFLGVEEADIKKYGVVSEVVAKAMAKGVANLAKAEVGLATSGIAGPTGGSLEKPVGMVCFAIFIQGKIYTYTKYFGNIGRNLVREKATEFILAELNKHLDS